MKPETTSLKKIQGNKPGRILAGPVFRTSDLYRGEGNRKQIQNNYKRNFLFHKYIILLVLICAFYKAEARGPCMTAVPSYTINMTGTPAGVWSSPNIANQLLILNVIASDQQMEVRVSFNGDEGLDGKLKIYNASKELVNQFEIKLKKSPDYFSILLNEFASGEYTVELTTSIGAHAGSFIIK